MAGLGDFVDIFCNGFVVAGLQCADVITMSISVAPFWMAFRSQRPSLQWRWRRGEADHGTDFDIGVVEQLCAQLDVGGVHTDGSEVIFLGFEAQLGNFVRGGVRFEHGMVNHTCQGTYPRELRQRWRSGVPRLH